MRVRVWVFGVIALVVLLWVVNLLLLPSVGYFTHGVDPERAGQFGDSFGAVNALFSGLGAFSIAIVLVMEHQRNKLGLRPFLIVEGLRANVATARMMPGAEFSVVVEASVANVTQNLALEISARVAAPEGVQSELVLANAPLRGGSSRGIDLTISFRGEQAAEFIRRFSDDRKFRLELNLSARSMDGSEWLTSSAFDLSPEEGRAGTLRAISEADSSKFVAGGNIGATTARMILSAKEVSGGVSQRELGRSKKSMR